MNVSIDLVLIIINLLALAFSYGRFSEKINTIEKRLAQISDFLIKMSSEYYTAKEGIKLEQQVDALWNKVDNCPCKTCVNLKHERTSI